MIPYTYGSGWLAAALLATAIALAGLMRLLQRLHRPVPAAGPYLAGCGGHISD